MKTMQRFGESKHQAKVEYRQACQSSRIKWNPSQADGIFSYKTYDAYRQTAVEFTNWVKANYSEIRNINAITRDHAKEYLQQRQGEGKSSWTLSKDMSALNKVFSTNLTKQEIGLRERTYHDVTRSREIREHDSKFNPKNYQDQILLAKASGCRRESVLRVKPEDFQRDEQGRVVSVHLKEKGGRERDATILQNYREQLTKIVDAKKIGQPLFDRYTSKIDNHAFRAEYASARYYELIQVKQNAGKQIRDNYRGYDRDCIQQVSFDIGHNRLSIVIEHYIQ